MSEMNGKKTMGYYLLDENMRECTAEELHSQKKHQYAAVLTLSQWEEEGNLFDLGIDLDMELDIEGIHNTKAEVNYDSLTGSFQIPNRDDLEAPPACFAFALDEKGVVFIDNSGTAEAMIQEIRKRKHWREPCLERFLYDFLEQLVEKDLPLMEQYEQELNQIEDMILISPVKDGLARVNEIRSNVRVLLVHYEQVIDMTQELEENENGFFQEKNLRYMHLFMNRIMRRYDSAVSLREHTIQVRDLYNSRMEVNLNQTMTILTVITTIFMPLTLIAGWYGMNFRYMPELQWEYGYPVVILVSILIVILCLVIFKKKKWL